MGKKAELMEEEVDLFVNDCVFRIHYSERINPEDATRILRELIHIPSTEFGFAALIAGAAAVTVARNDLQSPVTSSNASLYYGAVNAGGVIITFSTIAVVSQLAMIVLRFLNKCNTNINTFLTMNIILSVFLVVGYLSGSTIAAYVSARWHLSGLPDFEKVVASLVAGAVLCFVSLIVCIVLAVWMALFLIKNWNENLEDNNRRVLLASERPSQYFA